MTTLRIRPIIDFLSNFINFFHLSHLFYFTYCASEYVLIKEYVHFPLSRNYIVPLTMHHCTITVLTFQLHVKYTPTCAIVRHTATYTRAVN